MTLITNKVTDSIQQSVDRKDCALDIQSMHVSKDGKKALILGCFDNLDFPEVFIYSAKTGKARRVNSGDTFFDVPLGKAFWAENGRDFYMNCYDDDTIYKVEIDSKSYKIKDFDEVEERDDYIEAMLREVLDLVRDDNNIKAPVRKPVFENKHHEFLVKLLAGFEAGVKFKATWIHLWWNNHAPEVNRADAKTALNQFYGHYNTMESLKSELGVDLDTTNIKAALDKLETISKVPEVEGTAGNDAP